MLAGVGIVKRGRFSSDAGARIALSGKVVMHVLLGRDGDTISHGGLKMPCLQSGQDLGVDHRTQAHEHSFVHDGSCFVYADFDHHIASAAGHFRSTDKRVRSSNRQGRPNLRSNQRSFRE